MERENKMGTMPIPKLLFTIAFPIVVSMTIQALYNIIDSIFVAKISEEALTAVSLVFPVQSLMIAVAVGTGVGLNALISRSLGEKDFERCSSIAKNGVFLSIMNFVVFAVIGILFSKVFFSVQTDNQAIASYGQQYMMVITIFSIGNFTQISFERFLQSTGQTLLSMATQATGAIINIILDPILIFGLFGLPRMEVMGAAIATVIGQICAATLGFILVRKNITQFNISMIGFKPNKHTIKSIYQIAFPAILMQSIGSIMVFGINAILLMFSTTATAVFGVYFKLQSFVFMPVFGTSNGFVSILAYNYGAKHRDRMVSVHRLTVAVCCTIMFVGTICFSVFPDFLLSMFDASSEMLEMGRSALKIISIGFVFAGFSVVTSSFCQAIGKAHYSLILSLSRQLVIVLPLGFVLANVIGLNGVWIAIAAAEIISMFVAVFYVKRAYGKIINKI